MAGMKDVSEKTGISLGVLLTLLGLLGSGAATAVVAVYRVGEQERKIEKLETKLSAIDEKVQTQNTTFAELRAEVKVTAQTVEKMDAKLDRLLENRTNSAVYRGAPRGPTP